MPSVSTGILLDTNVLVYAVDPRDVAKQDRALYVLDRLISRGQAVLSAQCLSELFVVATRRLAEPLSPADALTQVERLSRACRVVDVSAAVVMEGCRGVRDHHLSLWDALIWAAARLNQVSYVLTEDAEHGRFLEGVRFLDPFRPDAHLDALLDPPACPPA
jgi:predicted nucleic acid-binding protein